MERVINNLIICWLIACAVHVPFPVWDGDNIGRIDFRAAGGYMNESQDLPLCKDLDFVFLGCDPPDDVDDGPIDADPENGSGPFGAVPMLHFDRDSRLIDCGVRGGQTSQDLVTCLLHSEYQDSFTCRSSAFSPLCRSVRSGHCHPVVIRC